MANFQNNPSVQSESGNQTVKRYVHQPLTFDHYGMHVKIQENGKVLVTGIPDSNGEFDELEMPASLIFKIAQSLKLTRSVVFAEVEMKK